MDKLTTMNEKELIRLEKMSQLGKKQITQKMVAEQLGLSMRQVKRLWKAYQEQGAAGLVNKNRGRPSHNQIQAEVKQQA